jgi:hypothetical protein
MTFLIAGAGPAGARLATALAEAGREVILVERLTRIGILFRVPHCLAVRLYGSIFPSLLGLRPGQGGNYWIRADMSISGGMPNLLGWCWTLVDCVQLCGPVLTLPGQKL